MNITRRQERLRERSLTRQRERDLRDVRVWDYAEKALGSVTIEDVRKECGLSWQLAYDSLERLKAAGIVGFQADVRWNGCYYRTQFLYWVR